jgi:FSR family fosmidomycin resistance protein-like MFS transporter
MTTTTPNLQEAERAESSAPATRSRVLWCSCVAHALHDGYTDMIYVLLPVWQTDFGLGYGALAMLRGLYAGTMASLQLPAGRLAQRLGSRAVLALGTLLAAIGYAAAGASGSPWRCPEPVRARSIRSPRVPLPACTGATPGVR